jgi:hypothetical protein
MMSTMAPEQKQVEVFVVGFCDGTGHPYLEIGLANGTSEYMHGDQAAGAFEMLISRENTRVITDSYLGLHRIRESMGIKGWFQRLIDVRSVREELPEDGLSPHLLAATVVGIDPSKAAYHKIMPKHVISTELRRRITELRWSYEGLDEDEVTRALASGDCVQTLSDAEHRGVPFGTGLKYPRFNYFGTSTNRILTQKGTWACMSLKRDGEDRSMIHSRYETGIIASLDFNAIDCRSLVALYPGSLLEIYEGADDFHARTAECAWGDTGQRRRAKAMTTALLYGGSEVTAAAVAGCSVDELRETWLPGFKDVFRSVWERRGPQLGIDCQTKSAAAFRAAVGIVGKNYADVADVLIPVHDELILDVIESESTILHAIARDMERAAELVSGVGHRVKISTGKTYAEATRSAGPEAQKPT